MVILRGVLLHLHSCIFIATHLHNLLHLHSYVKKTHAFCATEVCNSLAFRNNEANTRLAYFFIS